MTRTSLTGRWAAFRLAARARPARRSRSRVTRASARVIVAGAALAASWMLASTNARASCLDRFMPDIRRLDAEVDANATKTLDEIDARIDAARQARVPDPRLLGELYAVQARAFGILELDGSARAAASAGLEFATAPDDPVHLDLLSEYAANVYDAPDLARAATRIEAARRAQPPGSLADICLSITLGRIEYREDRSDLAVADLMHAYQSSLAPALRRQRTLAAGALAPVLRSMGDFSQALGLNEEVIERETAQGATLALSVARYLRGEIFASMRRYDESLDQFAEARALSVAVDDRQGIAFADLQMCRDEIELGQLADARVRCERALPTFAAARSLDVVKQDQAYLARIDLEQGHAARALVRLERVLEHGGAAEMPPRQLPFVLELRARTYAALHRYREAFGDLSGYLKRYRTAIEADSTTIAAAERARIETDREAERNAALQHALASAHELAARQRAELRWIAVAGGAGGLVIVLLTYILVTNLRYRRQLLRLAIEDGLTGLPNRRRTAQLASAALAASTAEQRPLTIALIDLDRFKAINDRGGHATGDLVLREFARIGRDCIRSGDILGRWGGEEFLLVLPDATLDTALASVDRLRALASAIELPGECAGLRVTLSAGLATSGADVRTLDEIIARADAALYDAKNGGRNLVRIADEGLRAASAGARRALRPI